MAAACAAGFSILPAAKADILGFTQIGAGPTDYTINANNVAALAGRPSIAAGELLLTSNQNDQVVSAFYNSLQGVNNFTASFTYHPMVGTNPPADGLAFVIQNSAPNALGAGGGALGYIGIPNSVAVALDVYNNAGGTRIGMGASDYGGFAYAATAPVDLRTGPIDVTLTYDNGYLTQQLTQGGNSFTRSINLNITDRFESGAYVGFTAATGGLNIDQKVSNFTYTIGNAPAAPASAALITGVPQGGMGFFGIREVQGAPSCCGNLGEAEAAILGSHPNRIDYTAPVLNIWDSDVRGQFQNDSPYQLGTPGSVDNIAIIATGTIRVPTTGMYTFGTNSDDGFRLTIGGQRFEAAFGQDGTAVTANGALEFAAGRGAGQPSFGTIFLPAGDHEIQILNWEGGGGASVELYSSPGAKTAFDVATFTLINGASIPEKNGRNRVLGMSQWTLKEYTDVPTIDDVLNNGRNNTGNQRGTTSSVSAIRFSDPQRAANGSHGADALAFPNDTPADDDNYGAFATATLTIAAEDAGDYTFVMYSDDQSRFRIVDINGSAMPLSGWIGDAFDSDGVNGNDQFGTNGCCSDQFGKYNLLAGTYTIEAAFREGAGGSGFFIYGTQGFRDNFDPAAFQLLGANIDGANWTVPTYESLKLVPEPGSLGLLGLAAVGLMARRRRQ